MATRKEFSPIPIYIVVSVAINIALGLSVRHASHTKSYSAAGAMSNLLLWTVAINVASAALIITRELNAKHSVNRKVVLLFEPITSLLPFVLIRCLRIPGPQIRLELFGLIYAVLIFSKAAALGWCLLLTANLEGREHSLGKWVFAVSVMVYSAIT